MLREYRELPLPVHVLCLGLFINRAGSFVVVFLSIYVSEQLGYGKVFASQCIGAFGLGSILAAFIGGQLADQVGRKAVMVFATLGGATLLVIMSMITSKLGLVAMILLYATVAETFRPACSAMLGDLTEPHQRPTAFGLFYVSINLGFACGPPIGGVLADISYKLLFWGDALTMAVFAVIILLKIPESKALIGTNTEAENRVPVATAIRQILADTPFVWFCLGTLLVSLVFMQCVATLPVHIKSAGDTNFEYEILMAINGGLIVICQLPFTKLLERFQPMSNVIGGGLIIAVGFGMYYLPVTTPLLICAVIVWTIGEMMQAPFKQTVVTNLAPLELRARYMGLFSMSYAIALTIGAPVGGFILDRYGPRNFWMVCFCVAVAGVLTYLAAFRQITERRTHRPVADSALRQPGYHP